MPYSKFPSRYSKYQSKYSKYKRGYPYVSAPGKSIVPYAYAKKETKFLDTTLDNGAAAPIGVTYNSPYLKLLCSVGQGAGLNQRVGSKIDAVNIRLNYVTSGYQSASALYGQVLRVLVFVDKWPNAPSTPNTVSTLLPQILQSGGNAANSFYSPIRPDTITRFTCLYDMQHMIAPATTNMGNVPHAIVIPVKSQVVFTPTATSGTPASNDDTIIARGAIWIYVTSDYSGSYAPQFVGTARLTYADD